LWFSEPHPENYTRSGPIPVAESDSYADPVHGAFAAISDLATSAPAPERVRLSVLVLILATLLVFVFGLVVILAVRRSLRPSPSSKKKPKGLSPDAWSEAGKRAAPIESEQRPPPSEGGAA